MLYVYDQSNTSTAVSFVSTTANVAISAETSTILESTPNELYRQELLFRRAQSQEAHQLYLERLNRRTFKAPAPPRTRPRQQHPRARWRGARSWPGKPNAS